MNNDRYNTEVKAQEIFKKCIEEHGDWLKGYMYMHTDSAGVHHFKNIISRRYVSVNV